MSLNLKYIVELLNTYRNRWVERNCLTPVEKFQPANQFEAQRRNKQAKENIKSYKNVSNQNHELKL